jgi:hypothetical protein
MLNDDPELLEHELVDFAAYGKVISTGLKRIPRDMGVPRLSTLTVDITRFLSDKKSQSEYNEYLHIGRHVFLDSIANAVLGQGLEALSTGPSLSSELTSAVAFI